MHKLLRLLVLLAPVMAWGQAAQPKIIDAHIHHNGEISFLRKLAARLRAADARGLLITAPKDLDSVKSFMEQNPNRLAGLGEIKLDDPNAVELVDRFHAAGFPGLGELTRPLRRYDDRSYWPIYARAEQYRMILLFHTGIVNRTNPNVPEDVSIDRMRPTTLDLIARRFPKLTIIGAHLGNPDYDHAAEVARWSPNLYFDLSGSTLIKKSPDFTFFNSVFWWSAVASPHTPKSKTHAFEKVVFGSDIFGGEIEEFDRTLANYRKMLDACGVPPEAQANIMGGTVWRILRAQRQ